MAVLALAVLLILAAVLVTFGVYVCAGLGVAAIVGGVLLAAYSVMFLAELPAPTRSENS